MNKTALTSLLCLLIFPTSAYAENPNDIREKFARDDVSYRTFLNLGKTSCMSDLFVETKSYRKRKEWDLYRMHFVTLYDLQSPLARIFSDRDMKKTFSLHQKQHIGSLIKQYRQREEYFNIHRSPFLICSKLFDENSLTKQLYQDFVQNPKHTLQENHADALRHWTKQIGRWNDNP